MESDEKKLIYMGFLQTYVQILLENFTSLCNTLRKKEKKHCASALSSFSI